MSVIAYSYAAAHHCVQCTFAAFSEPDEAEDGEGNPVHPLFTTDEWHEPSIVARQVLSCDDCGEEIDVYEDLDAIEEQARKDGADAGAAGGSWVVDPSMSQESLRALVKGLDDGDPMILDGLNLSPLSGEWSGDATPASVLAEYGLDEEHDAASDVLDAWEESYRDAFLSTVESDARNAIEWTPQERAASAVDWFETAVRRPDPNGRGDDETFVRLRDAAPSWLSDVIYVAHGSGSMLPDDWTYATVREVFAFVAESIGERDVEDEAYTFAEDTPDYTSELIEWLGSHSSRAGWVDEAIEEGIASLDGGIVEAIRAGCYCERRDLYRVVVNALSEVR